MERLTLVVPYSGEIWLLDSDGKPYSLIVEGEDRYDEIKKLSEYEDLEEQGKLLKLPCAVGDTVIDTETMIGKVSTVAEKHKNDFVPTGQINITSMCMDILPKLEKLKEYEQIGTVEECREARERQTPKQPDIWGDGCDSDGKIIYDMYDCPNCGKSYEIEGEEYKHCPNCGQAMNLSAAFFDNPELIMRIKALSEDVKSMDGHHAYLELVDEYHAYVPRIQDKRRERKEI